MPTALPARRAGVDDEQHPGVSRPGRSPALTSGIGRAAVRIGALTVCQAGLLTGFGLLITGPARNWWPLTVEDGVNEGFERIRTHALTSASLIGSGAGNTGAESRGSRCTGPNSGTGRVRSRRVRSRRGRL
ncbi:hypothetical protein ACWD3D_33425, partial [Streptomyces sp. NPDC002690]